MTRSLSPFFPFSPSSPSGQPGWDPSTRRKDASRILCSRNSCASPSRLSHSSRPSRKPSPPSLLIVNSPASTCFGVLKNDNAKRQPSPPAFPPRSHYPPRVSRGAACGSARVPSLVDVPLGNRISPSRRDSNGSSFHFHDSIVFTRTRVPSVLSTHFLPLLPRWLS